MVPVGEKTFNRQLKTINCPERAFQTSYLVTGFRVYSAKFYFPRVPVSVIKYADLAL
jgi:hypothetical protein